MTPLLTETDISTQIDRLADAVIAHCPDDFILIALMDGALLFSADLLRALYRRGCNPQMIGLGVSSYGHTQRTNAAPRITKEITDDITGRHCLIVDDVLESGHTLAFAQAHLNALGAASVKSCVLARKPYEGRQASADFVGWDAPDVFLVGYGLDDKLRYRGQPFISAITA